MGANDMHGIDEYYPWWKEAIDKYANTQHMLSPTFAEFKEDKAYTRTDVQALHYLKEPEGEILTLWATYETDMKRVNGGWKISRHRLVSRGIRQQ